MRLGMTAVQLGYRMEDFRWNAVLEGLTVACNDRA